MSGDSLHWNFHDLNILNKSFTVKYKSILDKSIEIVVTSKILSKRKEQWLSFLSIAMKCKCKKWNKCRDVMAQQYLKLTINNIPRAKGLEKPIYNKNIPFKFKT